MSERLTVGGVVTGFGAPFAIAGMFLVYSTHCQLPNLFLT